MKRLSALVSSALLLVACATTPPPPSVAPAEVGGPTPQQRIAQRTDQIMALAYWELRGRVAASAHERSVNMSLIWQQREEFFDIHMAAPLGQGTINLVGDPKQVVVSDNRGGSLIVPSAEILFAERLGLQVPFSYLRYWVVGIPSLQAKDTSYELDERGLLRTLNQDGWVVSYMHYRDVNNIALPDKVFIKNPEVSVRLIVELWDLKNPDLDAPAASVLDNPMKSPINAPIAQ